MLTPRLKFDDVFIKLVNEVWEHRAGMKICPSAQENVDVPAIILGFCDNAFYNSLAGNASCLAFYIYFVLVMGVDAKSQDWFCLDIIIVMFSSGWGRDWEWPLSE